MNIRCFLLAASFLLSPELVEASDNAKHGSLVILSLRQLSDLSGDPLPMDVLGGLSQTLAGLETHGVWLHEGAGKRWVPLTKTVEAMKAFRDGESSEADVIAVLDGKEQIKKGLLLACSAEWKRRLEALISKAQRHACGTWHEGKAYGAAFLAYYMIELWIAWLVAKDAASTALQGGAGQAAWQAAWQAPWKAAWHDASNNDYYAAWHDAYDAAWPSAMAASNDAAQAAFRPSAKQKFEILASRPATDLGQILYDLAEIFALQWLTENGHEYMKKSFEAVYEEFPKMELSEVKAMIKASIDAAAIKKSKPQDNMFLNALWRDLDALETFVLAK